MVALRKDPLLDDPTRVSVPPIFPDTTAVRGDIARMHTNIALMDRQVGELIQILKDDGLYDNTVIFFFADNGGNLPWMKREILERGTHVPLIVRYPGGQHAGTRRDELVSGVDLAPTVLSLAGVSVPGYMQGQPSSASSGPASRAATSLRRATAWIPSTTGYEWCGTSAIAICITTCRNCLTTRISSSA